MTAMRILRGVACLLALLALTRFAAAEGEAKPLAGTDLAASSESQKQYDDRAAKLKDADVKGWLALADWCETQLLFGKREEALRKVIAAAPDNPDAHRRLDEVKVGAEWKACTEVEAQAAKDHEAKGEVFYGKSWNASKSIGQRDADRRQFGWEIMSRVDGKACVVFSAASYEQTQAVASVIDSTVAGYAGMYGKVRKLNLSKPLVVHLFTAPDALLSEFKRMSKTRTDIPRGFAGGFSPPAKMELVSTDIGVNGWNMDTLLHTVSHESTHALDELGAGMDLNSMPTWVSEGRAIYAQYSLVGRQWLPGALNIGGTDGRGQELEKAYKTASLTTLIGLDHKAFMQNAVANYAVAWSFTHFLLHAEGGKYRDRYLRFLAGCPQHSSAAEFQKLMGKASDMEGPWRTYVETVFLPALKASSNTDRKAKGLAGEWK